MQILLVWTSPATITNRAIFLSRFTCFPFTKNFLTSCSRQIQLFPTTCCILPLLPPGEPNLPRNPFPTHLRSWHLPLQHHYSSPIILCTLRSTKPHSRGQTLLPMQRRSLHLHLRGWAWWGGDTVSQWNQSHDLELALCSSKAAQTRAPLSSLLLQRRCAEPTESQQVINHYAQNENQVFSMLLKHAGLHSTRSAMLTIALITPAAAPKLSLGSVLWSHCSRYGQ